MSTDTSRQDRTGPTGARLSLSMIVKNEEKFIGGCLESVKGLVDEIIIVDTGSTDRTIEIAHSYHANIIPFAWIGDFSAARNESLRHCTGEWILYLDADERIAPESAQVLRSVLDTDTQAFTCLVRGDQLLPAGTKKSVTRQHRLFRRHPNVYFEGKVHERMEDSLFRAGGASKASSIYIDHLGYAQSVEINIKKIERNLSLLRTQLDAHPDDAYAQFQIGNTLALLCRNDEATRELQKALAMPTLNGTMLPQVLNLLSALCMSTEGSQKGIEYGRRSLQLFGNQTGVRWTLAGLFMSQREYTPALHELRQIISIQSDPGRWEKMATGFDAAIPLDEAWCLLGVCCEEMGNIQEAVSAYVQALHLNAHHAHAQERLLLCSDGYEDLNSIHQTIEWLHTQLPDAAAVTNQLVKISLRMKKYKDVEKLLFGDASHTANEETPALQLEYCLAVHDLETAAGIYERFRTNDSYAFHKVALQYSLAIKNTTLALEHLGKMSRGVEDISVRWQKDHTT